MNLKQALVASLFALPFASLLSNSPEAFVYPDSLHGKVLPLGGLYQRDQLTCGHATIAIGSAVRVTNLANKRSVDLLVNDAWQKSPGNIMISGHAANILGIPKGHRAKVHIQRLSHPVESGATTTQAKPIPKIPPSVTAATTAAGKTKPTTTATSESLYFLEYSSYKTLVQANLFARKLAKSGVQTKAVKAPDGLYYVISTGYFTNLTDASTAFYAAQDKAGYMPRIKRLQ